MKAENARRRSSVVYENFSYQDVCSAHMVI